jgi:pimeloyl-ACP methyl ester carboxylesterase
MRAWVATAFCVLTVALAASAAWARNEIPRRNRPVEAIVDGRLDVQTPAGQGVLPVYASHDWRGALPAITRAIIVIHGVNRDAVHYIRYADEARQRAGVDAATTLLLVPQFLAEQDIDPRGLSADTLRWHQAQWEDGRAAVAPAGIGSFEALDAVLAQLADRTRFPALRQVVVAGHSGGGQVVQRYAVVGQGESRLHAVGIAVRYLIANPSSYLYFSPDRPDGSGAFAPVSTASCPAVNRWKYGWDDAPPYARVLSPAEYEARYLQRQVTYLLGGADTNPQHPALDKSCAGEAQGAWRLVRGLNYVAYLRARHADFAHAVWEVPGVGHDAGRMFGSVCGQAALFDKGNCSTIR